MKNYASYQSLWIHNKKFHSCANKKLNISPEKLNISSIATYVNKLNFDPLQCYYCNKFFKHISSREIVK